MRRMRIHNSCHLVMMLIEADCDAYWLLPLIVIIYCQCHCYHYHFLSINVYSVRISEKNTCHYNDWYSFSLALWFFTNPAPTWTWLVMKPLVNHGIFLQKSTGELIPDFFPIKPLNRSSSQIPINSRCFQEVAPSSGGRWDKRKAERGWFPRCILAIPQASQW